MKRSKGDMASPTSWLLLAALSFIATSRAGPIGPLNVNVTSTELGLKEGSCAVGDLVYMPGDEFPGATPCERCACAAGGVQCARTRCEPRPGCKALHRPDQCCPTYQCECEQEGRVYGNGEKLVDPADPCRVCYCQGGEVVCRRIACFLRDDCQPRLVPGRCCPEYDNCPLRGVTTVPGAAPSMTSMADNLEPSAPPAPKENIKQEITIKEITPVSEIPVISDVKIQEIIPSPAIEVAEYSSSKSPLIAREATTEKTPPAPVEHTERPVIIEILPSSSSVFIPSSASSPAEIVASSSEISEVKTTNDAPPSKISFSTQDSINSEIYPSNEPVVGTVGSPAVIQEVIPVATTTKGPAIIEEEDPNLFDHNPAFPPIPDDLSVLSNHDDEMITDQNMENDHVSNHDVVTITSTTTETPITPEVVITSVKDEPEIPTTTFIVPETPAETVSTKIEDIKLPSSSTKETPMLNLRSAIPTEILNVPSVVPEEITGELDETTVVSTVSVETSPVVTTTETPYKEILTTPKVPTTLSSEISSTDPSPVEIKHSDPTSTQTPEMPSTQRTVEEIPGSTGIFDISSEWSSQTQTELSSLPVETSDQNPHEVSAKDKSVTSSAGPAVVEETPTKLLPVEPEVITVSRNLPTNIENQPFENVETTEFILTSFGSAESATDAVELIKISPEAGKSAAIIESTDRKKNSVLTDLINLVGDVASISDHTDTPTTKHVTSSPISDSEELIPVNAGYKSKNNNWNVNSITEVVPKSKYPVPVNKQKIVEIEDDDDALTDAPPPNDKVEPTTRRPIIDNVSDDKPENKTSNKDIEIIPQTYVPGVERRPTKVVMKESNEKPISGEISVSSETATELAASAEYTTPAEHELASSEAGERIDESSTNSTSSSTPQ